MSTDAAPPARLDEAAGRRLCEALYWSPTLVEPLAGYDDSSFLVANAAGERFVLKIAAVSSDRALLEFQGRVLSRLESLDLGRLPRIVGSRHGRTLEEMEIGGSMRLVRLLTFLPGYLLADLPVRPPSLLASLGRFLGRLDRALAGLDESVARRHLEWDIARLGEMPGLAASIRDPEARQLARAMIDRYVDRRADLAPGLRRGLIHNDANDRNVLVSSRDPESAELAGLIDFGDLVESDRLVELAVAMAYAGLGSADPWSTALPVLAGYHREYALTEEEIELLFPAVGARLGLSVCMSARRLAEGLADEYALISEAPAWDALRSLDKLDVEVAANAARLMTVGAASRV